MTTFAKRTFDAVGYAAGRPTIPQQVIDAVLARAGTAARSAPRTALDLGCGPGQLARVLASSGIFASVRGVDPSPGMIETARSIESAKPVDYAVGTAENADTWAKADEFDLICAVQAAHWFDHGKAYAQLARILKPGGTLAYLGYGEFYLPDHPTAAPLIRKTMQGDLEDYWEPGRKHVDAQLDSIPFPEGSAWDSTSFHRSKWIDDPASVPAYLPPKASGVQSEHVGSAILERRWTHAQLQTYINSVSALHTYEERHGAGRRAEFGAQVWKSTGLAEDASVAVRWPVTAMTMRKRA